MDRSINNAPCVSQSSALTRRDMLGVVGGGALALGMGHTLTQAEAFAKEESSSSEASNSADSGNSDGTASNVTTEPFKAASLQFNPVLYNLDDNIANLCDVLEEVLAQDVRLVTCPEMCTTGYTYANRADIAPYVDTIPGKATDAVGKLCAQYNAYVVFGMAELEEESGIYYNSAVLVGPDGVIGKYRKTHVISADELWCGWGDLGFPVFDTELGKIGINICMDSAYWESARMVAVNGANILCFPTNSSSQAVSALQGRAVQNGMYVVSANRSNEDAGWLMCGGSAIWSPLGEKLAECDVDRENAHDDPSYVIAEIDPALYQNDNRARFATRRPEIYKDLLIKVAPNDSNATSVEDGINVTAIALQYEPGASVEDTEAIVNGLLDDITLDPGLIVLPELSLTGQVEEPFETLTESESFAAGIAQQFTATVVIGGIEQDGDAWHNTAAIVGPDGEIISTYRKTHLGEEDAWATAGDTISVIADVPYVGRLGVLIGDDLCYPETFGIQEVYRADVIANLTAWHGQYGCYATYNKKLAINQLPDNSMVLWDSAAQSSYTYVVTANFVGGEQGYLGSSSLMVPSPLYGADTPITASTDETEALVVSFHTVNSSQQYMITTRETTFYKPMVMEN